MAGSVHLPHLGIFIQIGVLVIFYSTMVLSQDAANSTETCDPLYLPCDDPACVIPRSTGGDRDIGGPSVCTCPSSGYQAVKYCYTKRPEWSNDEKSKQYMECKWGSGRPAGNSTRSDTMVTPLNCNMGLHAFCPDVGPVSGGTDVMVWGHGFSNISADMDVSFTGFTCEIVFSNSTFIHCLTSSVLGTNARGSFLRLRIRNINNGCRLEERSAYTYHADPSITNMTPLHSFLGGGTPITVTGANFNHVAKVIMKITTIYGGNTVISVSECSRRNRTLVICPAPQVHLDADELQSSSSSSSRRRRQTSLQRILQIRSRRQAAEGLLQGSDLSVYAGLKMDGLIPGQLYSAWQIYQNPIVEEFPGEFLNYRPTWPDFDEFIFITGEYLLSGVSPSEYTVTIGSIPCKELVFTSTSIQCTPPDDPPVPPPGALQRDGNPALVVKVGNLEYVVGYVHYDLDAWSNFQVRYAVIGVLAAGIPILVCIGVLIGVRCYYQRRNKKKAVDDDDFFPTKGQSTVFTASEKNDFVVGDYLHPRAKLIQAVSPELRAQVQDCLIHAGRVDKTHIKTREGENGAVYRGWLLDEKGSRMMSADVKTFKHDNTPFRDLKTFLEDAVKLRGYTHDNVQRLVAITISDNIPSAICPSSEYGDLKAFLYKQRQRQEGQEELTIDQMVSIGENIAEGMTYLSEKGFVHEDLAARNCVVDKDLVVKVADATLSRDIYELDYWRPGEKLELRPVKWMAPESLDTNFFSVKSDVWSFGVTLWEIFSLGMTPYTDIANADIKDHLRQGYRLSKPDVMPVSLYKDITHCWAKEPNKRPHFQALLTSLQEFGNPSSRPTTSNNIMDDVGGNSASTTSAARISAYIEEGTRQRESLEKEENSQEDPDDMQQESIDSQTAPANDSADNSEAEIDNDHLPRN